MRIRVLAENTTASEQLGCEHGLSLYIETKKYKLLFDTGASTLFAENAAKMNIDLSQVDLAVISHGHYDHAGGLKTFLNINDKAKVYLHQNAFQPCFAFRPNGSKAYIGLDKALMDNERLIFCGQSFIIDEGLELFSNVKGDKRAPSGNSDLFKLVGENFLPDDFTHEQNLVISEGGKKLLIAGCAHNGILNILDRFYADKGCMPDYVIGGFHLFNPLTKESEDPAVIAEIGQYLLDTKAKYYTCHCTGMEAYQRLKAIMGDKIDYLSGGNELTIEA
ncbi:hypothetical protein SDC9_43972 [bioreactor metagenome]|uniref:Metallo-beta-lactamase domain-containing protein n=1 Tax=bioreactor metagenome TaxID=1076179 RepID=A0A644W2G2_9ZZZZ